MLQFRGAAASHVGLVRTDNEDSGFAGPYLLMVADGVGGHAAGEVASSTGTYITTSLSMSRPAHNPQELLRESVNETIAQLQEGVAQDSSRTGMSTTLTAICTNGEAFALGHVGDSRAYRWRGEEFVQLTRDHTLVQAYVDAGTLTPEEARQSPRRNVVLQAVGTSGDIEPDVEWLDLAVGDRILVCSDGLSDLVEDTQIATLLAGGSPDDAAQALIQAALHEGGVDNITCVVADVVDGPRVDSVGRLVGAVLDPSHIVNWGGSAS